MGGGWLCSCWWRVEVTAAPEVGAGGGGGAGGVPVVGGLPWPTMMRV